MKRIAFVVGIFLVGVFRFIHPEEGYYGRQTHEGGVHFTPNYGVSVTGENEGDVGSQSGLYITLEAGQSGSPLSPVLRQPLHQERGQIWQLDRMKPRHFVALFAMRGWNADQILSNSTWYIYDSFITVVKQLPQYEIHLNRLYKRWHNAGDEEKIKGWLTSKYVAGLEDRIIFLKKENDLIQERKRDQEVRQLRLQEEQEAWRRVEHTFETQHCLFEAIFRDCGLVYQEDDDILNRNDRCIKREYAFEEITTSGAVYTKQSYTISQDVRTLIETSYSPGNYTKCYGNQLQHVIHQDCIDLLQDTVAMPLHSPLHEHTPALVELIDAAREYNQAGECPNALEVSDLCCSLLAYGQAVAQGAVQGLAGVVEYSVDHPIETAVMVVVPEAALIYQLSKVVCDVAKIGITYVHDKGEGAQQAADYIAPITDLIDAFSKNKLTGPEVVQGVTQFAVGWKAHNKLLGGLGTLYGDVRTKAQVFFKKNPAATLQEYVQTTEGQLLRVVNPETEREYEKLVQLSKQQGKNSSSNKFSKDAPKKGVKSKKLTMDERRQLYNNQRMDKSSYTYEYGIAKQADINPKHHTHTKAGISKIPLGEQEALDCSVALGGNSKARVGVSKGQLVMFQDSNIVVDGKRQYHGYVIDNIDGKSFSKARKELERLGQINSKGEPIKQ